MRNILAVAALPLLTLPALAQTQTYQGPAGPLAVETVVRGLDHPWALAFLPEGRMLITERNGKLRLAGKDGRLAQVSGVPRVFHSGQGGLHDVILDRGFAQNRTIYICYAEPYEGGGRTAMARAILSGDGGSLSNVKIIFQQKGPPSRGNHFGCRIVQANDGNLFLTTGDHYTQRDMAQTLDNHIGKMIRVTPDGAAPRDNPFVGKSGALPEIWSYGHRNMQGAALHPQTGAVWEHEHGPRGGDEVNIPQAGKNYGWPVIGYGVDYSGAKIHESASKPGMEQPVKYWVPSIAPSGMAFYTGDLFPAWKGSLFVGALRDQMLVRLTLDGGKVVREERMLQNLGERIRDVRQGPDGALYLVTDNSDGRVLRITPGK